MSEARRQFFDTPPLHYTGGKWKVADWIIGQFPPHDIYVEPFCGGASVFFRKHASQVEVLNDLDGDIINFFDVLRDQTDVLLRAIERTPWARAEYERAVGEPASDPLERARRFYVGCWQSFGGTLVNRSGWRHQRRAQQYTPLTQSWKRRDGLLDAAERLRDAQIDCRPAIDVIQHYDSKDTLFYIDPPYVLGARMSSGKRRYRHEMDDSAHIHLAEVLHEVRGMVVLSGYPSDLYDALYGDWTRLEKTATTTGGDSIEVLWLSPRATALSALPLFANNGKTR